MIKEKTLRVVDLTKLEALLQKNIRRTCTYIIPALEVISHGLELLRIIQK